jgi:hypothetical protein
MGVLYLIVAFVGFSRIFLLGILIFKGLTARRFYKSFGVKGLMLLEGTGVGCWATQMCSVGSENKMKINVYRTVHPIKRRQIFFG